MRRLILKKKPQQPDKLPAKAVRSAPKKREVSSKTDVIHSTIQLDNVELTIKMVTPKFDGGQTYRQYVIGAVHVASLAISAKLAPSLCFTSTGDSNLHIMQTVEEADQAVIDALTKGILPQRYGR